MKMKKIIPLVLISAMTLSSCGSASTPETTADEPVLTAVKVIDANDSGITKSVSYSGKIQASESVSVISKLTGTVTNTYKEVGDTVSVGETLYRVDDTDVNLAISQAEAQANAANLAVKSAENAKNNITGSQYDQSLLSLQSSIDNLQTSLDSANESLAFAQSNYENAKVLYNAGAMSKVDFDSAELQYNTTKSQVTQLESQLNQAKQSYEITKNNTVAESQNTASIGIEQAQASAKTANLAVESARKNLEYVAPTAPISGVVSAKNAVVGQMISTGTVAYTVSNIDTVVASVSVSENIINDLQIGDTVNVKINSLGQELQGTITEINPVADQTSTYPIKIEIQNPDHEIKPGMFCEVEIVTDNTTNTITVPREAVLNNMGQQYVYIVENGVANSHEVETGVDNGESIEIVSGVTPGDKVIVEGQTYVTNGENVNIVE